MLLLPPSGQGAVNARWTTVRECYAGTRWQQALDDADVRNGLAVYFNQDGSVCVICSNKQQALDYEFAVLVAVGAIVKREPEP